MEVLGFLLTVPLAGAAAGWLVAVLVRRGALQGRAIVAPVLIALPVGLVLFALFGIEALRYSGSCSGFREQGSHPCSRLEYAFQDWELGLIFAALPTVIAVAVAFVVYGKLARFQKA